MNWNSTLSKRILGRVPVEEDGSAYFALPAGRFVYFQLLDADVLVAPRGNGDQARNTAQRDTSQIDAVLGRQHVAGPGIGHFKIGNDPMLAATPDACFVRQCVEIGDFDVHVHRGRTGHALRDVRHGRLEKPDDLFLAVAARIAVPDKVRPVVGSVGAASDILAETDLGVLHRPARGIGADFLRGTATSAERDKTYHCCDTCED